MFLFSPVRLVCWAIGTTTFSENYIRAPLMREGGYWTAILRQVHTFPPYTSQRDPGQHKAYAIPTPVSGFQLPRLDRTIGYEVLSPKGAPIPHN